MTAVPAVNFFVGTQELLFYLSDNQSKYKTEQDIHILSSNTVINSKIIPSRTNEIIKIWSYEF